MSQTSSSMSPCPISAPQRRAMPSIFTGSSAPAPTSASTRRDTRSGSLAASAKAGPPPSEKPTIAARSMLRASSTPTRSRARCAAEYCVATGGASVWP